MKQTCTFLFMLATIMVFGSPASSQITYWLDPSALNSPERDRIIKAMDSCISVYNQYSNYDEHVRVKYDQSIPTANAGYKGRIAFGGSIGPKTAMHELSHVLGVGTYRKWDNNRDAENKVWTGENAIAQLKAFDGEDAILHCDKWHFWPYGLNKKWADVKRHVYMVGALREDMGLSNTSGEGTGVYCNPAMLESFSEVNHQGELDVGMAFAEVGADVRLEASTIAGSQGTWSWSGPDDYTATGRSILLNDVQKSRGGQYTVEFTKDCDAVTTRKFDLIVHRKNPYYGIQVQPGFLMRPESDTVGSRLNCAPDTSTNQWVQWDKINADNGFFYLRNRKTGMYFRPTSDANGALMEQVSGDMADRRAQWKLQGTGDGYTFIINRSTGKKFRINNGDVDQAYIEQTKTSKIGSWTRWKFEILDEEKNDQDDQDDQDDEETTGIFDGEDPFGEEDGMYCRPNPFSENLKIRFKVPKTGAVWLEIFHISGKKIHTLIGGKRYHAGTHAFTWNGRDGNGTPLPSGSLVIVRYRIGQHQTSAKVLVE